MTGLGGVRPDRGARVSLELETEGAERITYRCKVLQADVVVDGVAHVFLPQGNVELQALDGVPEWVRTLLVGLLRSAFRACAEEGWPRRITRWRKEPA